MSLTTAQEFEIEVSEDPVRHQYFDATGSISLVRFSIILYGWILANPSGSVAAVMNFYDGNDTTGNPDFPITLASSESISDYWGDRGILCLNGLYGNVTAGEVKGSILYRRVHKR